MGEIINLRRARKAKAREAAARTAAANRATFGRTKVDKIRRETERARLDAALDGAKLSPNADADDANASSA